MHACWKRICKTMYVSRSVPARFRHWGKLKISTENERTPVVLKAKSSQRTRIYKTMHILRQRICKTMHDLGANKKSGGTCMQKFTEKNVSRRRCMLAGNVFARRGNIFGLRANRKSQTENVCTSEADCKKFADKAYLQDDACSSLERKFLEKRICKTMHAAGNVSARRCNSWGLKQTAKMFSELRQRTCKPKMYACF